jgi:hypothetical protein
MTQLLTVHRVILPVACVYTIIKCSALCVRLANKYISLTNERYTRHRPLSVVKVYVFISFVIDCAMCNSASSMCTHGGLNLCTVCPHN